MRSGIVLSACALAALGCAVSPPAVPVSAPVEAAAPVAEPIRLTIVGTNDFHGWLSPHEVVRKDGEKILVGGVSTFASYLAVLRERNPGGVVLLDGGDLFQGTLASNLTEGAAVIEIYGALGYDAAAVGNHEFDFGPTGPKITADAPGEDPLGALKARAAEARFPLLAANVREKATGARPSWLSPSTIVERRGVKIGVVGLATPDTPQVTIGKNVESLVFGDPVEAAREEAASLRARGATVVVLVAHIGGRCPGPEQADCEGELLELVRRLPRGAIDVAIGGHTHRVVRAVVEGVPVIESGALGKAFGVVELAVDPATKRVLPPSTVAEAGIEICRVHAGGAPRCDPSGGADGPLAPAVFHGVPVGPEPTMEARLEPLLARVAELKARPLGTELSRPLGRDYEGESELGNLVADAILALVPEADLALTNSGGLRNDLPAGPLTYGHAYEVIPFDNRLAVVTLTGAELRELLRLGFAGVHGGLQVGKAQVTLDLARKGACAERDVDGDGAVTALDRERVARVLIDGKPVDDTREYRVATNDFLSGGGSGWDKLLGKLPPSRVRVLEDRPILREALVAHLSGQGTFAPPPKGGRVIKKGESPRCPPGR